MSKKQTAVEWLESQIDNKDMGEIPMWIYEFIDKAIAMEKEQIIQSYSQGVSETKSRCEYNNPDQYYTETYEL